MQKEWEAMIDSMSLDDMPNRDMRDVAEFCGLDVARSLLRFFAGAHIIIPKQRAFLRIAQKFIVSNFDGKNAKHLSRITGCSLSFVYDTIKKEDSKRQSARPKFKQLKLSLFGEEDQNQGPMSIAEGGN
jgi:Mor family transcriptional regulator